MNTRACSSASLLAHSLGLSLFSSYFGLGTDIRPKQPRSRRWLNISAEKIQARISDVGFCWGRRYAATLNSRRQYRHCRRAPVSSRSSDGDGVERSYETYEFRGRIGGSVSTMILIEARKSRTFSKPRGYWLMWNLVSCGARYLPRSLTPIRLLTSSL
jgi:hypothetical protein